MRIEIRLAARKRDFDFVVIKRVNLIKIGAHIIGGQIDEMIRRWAAEDIAIGAFNIAKRA